VTDRRTDRHAIKTDSKKNLDLKPEKIDTSIPRRGPKVGENSTRLWELCGAKKKDMWKRIREGGQLGDEQRNETFRL